MERTSLCSKKSSNSLDPSSSWLGAPTYLVNPAPRAREFFRPIRGAAQQFDSGVAIARGPRGGTEHFSERIEFVEKINTGFVEPKHRAAACKSFDKMRNPVEPRRISEERLP
ncbi:hypothetical protein EJB05_14843, partial [Eragrostis curvula]